MSDLRIGSVETFLVGREWNNLLLVRVRTDDGLSGVGEGTMQWQAATVASAVELLFRRYLAGQSAFAIEKHVQAMYRNEYARGGPVLNSAIAALEMCLWDICGKALGQPVHRLLGGAVHDKIPAYANGWSGDVHDFDAVTENARAAAAAGYGGMKFDPFWDLGADPEPAVLRRGLELVGRVRDAVGPDVRIMVDGHGRFSVGTANYVAHGLADHDVFWFEEPVAPENFIALGAMDRPRGLLIATGERCFSRYQYPQLIAEGRPHVLQPDIIQVGGLMEGKKIAALADSHYLPVSFHSPFGPIATAAAVQLDAATTNIVSQESFSAFDLPWRKDLVTNCPMPVDGAYPVSMLPGLGVELNDAVVAEHPYREDAVQAMWTVNGTMTSWRDTAAPAAPTDTARAAG